MPKAATAFVDFEGDFSHLGKGASAQSRKLESTFNSSFRRIATFAAGVLATVGVGTVLKDAFSEAQEAQTLQKQTAAVLKSTGGAANVTSKDVDRLANSLSLVAGQDDELIAHGENVLLTFRNIRNEVGAGNDIFNQATTASVNLSAALGKDLQSSAILVGKALNDPIAGLTALGRAGVQFTKKQKDQLKALVANGQTLEAQKIILRELTAEFGGAAAATATPTQKLGVAVKNIEETFGLLFLPVIQKVANFLANHVAPAIQELIPHLHALGGFAVFAFQVGFGQKSISGIHGWLSIFARLGAVIRGFVDFVRGDVVHAGLDFGRAFGIDDQSATVTKTIRALAVIRKAAVALVSFIARNWKPILLAAAAALLLFLSPIVLVVGGLIALYVRFAIVREGVARFIEFFQRNWPTIQAVGTAVINVLIGAVQTLIPTLIDLGRGLAAVVGFLRQNKDVSIALAAVLAPLVAAFLAMLIVNKVRDAISAMRTAMLLLNASFLANPVVLITVGIVALGAAVVLAYRHFQTFHDAVDRAWQILQSTFHWVQHNWPLLLAILTGPIGLAALFVVTHWGAILGFFKSIPGEIKKAFIGLAEILVAPYRAAFNGIARLWNNTVGKLSFHIPSWVPKIGGKGFDVPDIPTLHTGGIFEATGGQGLALLRSGEGVFTPSQMAAMGPGSVPPIDARLIVNGNVIGLDALDEWADQRDRKLVGALRAGSAA